MSASFGAFGGRRAHLAPLHAPGAVRALWRVALAAGRSRITLAVLAGAVLWLAIGLWIALVPKVGPQLTNTRSPGPGLDDFGAFYSAARMVRDGDGSEIYNLDALARQETQVYERPANRYSALPFFNTPAFAAALAPLTFLPVGTAGTVFLLLTGALFVLAVAMLWRASRVGYSGAWLLFAMALVYQSVQDTVYHGQLAFVLLFSFVSAFVAFRRGNERLGGLALALLLLKPNLLLAPVALLLWKRRRDALIGLGAGAVICAAVSVAAAGPAVLWEYPQFLRQASLWDDQHGIGIAGMFGWNALVRLQVGPGQTETVLLWSTLLSVPTLAVTLWTWRGPWRAGERAMSTQFSALVICSLLINPHVYRQDMILMFIPGFLLLGATDARVRGAVAVALFIAWGLFLYHFPLVRETGWDVSALVMAALLAMAALLTLRRPTPLARWRRPATVLSSRAVAIAPSPWPALAAPRTVVALPERAGRPLLSVVITGRSATAAIEDLLARLRGALSGAGIEAIVVDHATDGAAEGAVTVAGVPVTWVARSGIPRGAASPALRALRLARGEHICVIDRPAREASAMIIDMLARARRGQADVIVARRSHALRGGAWSRARSLAALVPNVVSKALFYERLRAARDPHSGFFLFNRAVIEGVSLRPVGDALLTEILIRGRWSALADVPHPAGAAGAATPLSGALRRTADYLRHTLRIFVEVAEVAHAWRFLCVGGSGVFINLALLWATTSWLGFNPHAGWAIGVECSLLSNFMFNRMFTWRDRHARGARGIAAEAARYHLACAAGIAANLAVFTAASWLGAPTLVAGAAGIVAGMAMNFVGCVHFVFRAPSTAGSCATEIRATPPAQAYDELLPAEAAAQWGRA